MAGVLPVRKIYVDSRYKTSNSKSNSDFKYELSESVSLPDKSVMFIDDVIIPNSWLNIDLTNNLLYVERYFFQSGTKYYDIVPLTPGNYTAATLRTELESKLNASFTGLGAVVTYDASYLHFRINVEQFSEINIFSDKHLKKIYENNYNEWDPAQPYDPNHLKSANDILSINYLDVEETANNPFYTGLIDLRRYHNLYITSPNLSSFTTLAPRGLSTVIKKVPVTSDYGTILYDNVVSNHDWVDVSKMLLKTLEFRITDVHGNVVDLRGLPVSFSLIFMLEQD